MKLGPVKNKVKNKATSRKFDNYVISENCDVIAIFPIYGQFGAIWNPDSESIVCICNFLSVTFNLIKTENRTKKSLTQLSNYCFVQQKIC